MDDALKLAEERANRAKEKVMQWVKLTGLPATDCSSYHELEDAIYELDGLMHGVQNV